MQLQEKIYVYKNNNLVLECTRRPWEIPTPNNIKKIECHNLEELACTRLGKLPHLSRGWPTKETFLQAIKKNF